MSMEEKNYYYDIKNNNDTLFNKLNKYKNINPVLLFVQTLIDNSKAKKEKIPTIKDITKMWLDLTE
jgi:hypothetical protein